MLYLSETVSIYSVNKPQKEKIEVLSSRVSGQSTAYGLSAPRFFNFYDNNIFIGDNLNPRGFISPIADNAISHYKYKFEGDFFEDGRTISKIKVIPRRKYEPLFSGYTEDTDNWPDQVKGKENIPEPVLKSTEVEPILAAQAQMLALPVY